MAETCQDTTQPQNIEGERLKQFVESIETLKAEQKALSQLVEKRYAEAKSAGLDDKVIRRIIAERAIKPEKRKELAAIEEVYKKAMGIE